ncbi:MAG TPA: glycoside hydrolase family 2 TIM barrel-domain containing protein [Candidatus Limnocylindrales bacterium]|nr:glycoside hydrolase family 2 TIM barrel-domain containing protein [Candidatus Limnocylindrales bacterium]
MSAVETARDDEPGAGVVGGVVRPWAAPELTSWNRLPMHAVPHDERLPLDGTWRFQLLHSPEERPGSDWGEIRVPGAWTMQGTWDRPHYTNVRMPFPNRPPEVPAENPTGVYERTFEVPAEWDGRRVVLHVGAAESVLIVALDGIPIGISKDSHLAAEFDLTGRVRAGASHTVRLTVVKWSDASFVEDQDQWWHGGITRSVFLYSTGLVHLADVVVDAGLGPDLATGTLALEVHVGWPAELRAPGWRVEAELEGLADILSAAVPHAAPPPGRPGDWEVVGPPRRGILDLQSMAATRAFASDADRERWEAAEPVVRPPRVGVVRLEAGVPRVTPWSAEVPALARLTVTLRAPDGSLAERIERRIGFRNVRATQTELLVNGKPVLIHGVNRHDFDPKTGRTVTAEQIRADLVLMKQFNVNAVRTSHYPNDEALLDLCDELGVYVVDEADIESHAYIDDLCHDPRYRAAWVDRVARMVTRDRRHPSVIAWSLGNESGHGANHDAAAGWARRADPSRPLHYEGAIRYDWLGDQRVTDITCPMYPPISAIVAYATSGRQQHPLIMCEYSHAMGNSNGTLGEYWEAIEATPGLQGGFIWEWRDHGLEQRLPDGSIRWAYGGDFGDEPNDGTFVTDGVTFPDRSPKPGLWELKQIAAPLRLVSGADDARRGVVVVENRAFFRDSSWISAAWAVEVDGVAVAGGDLPLPVIAAGDRAEVTVPGFELPGGGGREVRLTLHFTAREATQWAPAGHDLGWVQVELEPGKSALGDGPWTGDVALDADGRLRHPAFGAPPELTLWRAPTDNDRIGGMAGRWAEWGVATLTRTLEAIERGRDETVVRSTWRTASGIAIPHEARLARDPSGRLLVRERVSIPAELPDLPRVGTVLTLAAGHETLTWFGTGPHETYPDRARGGRVARWTSTVTDQLVPYVRPQENGGHAGVRWLEITGLRIELDEPRQVSALHVTAADLDVATHDVEVRQRPGTFVTIDAVHRGVGTASCGPDTLPQYLVPTGVHEWAYLLGRAEGA